MEYREGGVNKENRGDRARSGRIEDGEGRGRERWREEWGEERRKEEGEGTETNWRDRVRKIERKYEIRERGERKRNILMRGLKEKVGGMKREVEKVIERIGVEIKVKEIRRIEAGRKKRGSRIIIRVENEDEKMRIMQNKWKLKGAEIEDDLTWEERRIKWKITQIARKEESEGRRVRIGRGKVWIEGEWWIWDEEREGLRDRGG